MTMLEAIEARGWSVTEHETHGSPEPYLLLEWFSPKSEDICIETTLETLSADLLREYDSYDVDEHVDLWAPGRGKRGVPSSYAALVEDAEAIGEELHALSLIARGQNPQG